MIKKLFRSMKRQPFPLLSLMFNYALYLFILILSTLYAYGRLTWINN